jgi:hypothetical protein
MVKIIVIRDGEIIYRLEWEHVPAKNTRIVVSEMEYGADESRDETYRVVDVEWKTAIAGGSSPRSQLTPPQAYLYVELIK